MSKNYLDDLTNNIKKDNNIKEVKSSLDIKKISLPLHKNIVDLIKRYHKTTKNDYIYQTYNELLVLGLQTVKCKIGNAETVTDLRKKSKIDALPSKI